MVLRKSWPPPPSLISLPIVTDWLLNYLLQRVSNMLTIQPLQTQTYMFCRNFSLLSRPRQCDDVSVHSAVLLSHSQRGKTTLLDRLLRWRLEGRGLQHKTFQCCESSSSYRRKGFRHEIPQNVHPEWIPWLHNVSLITFVTLINHTVNVLHCHILHRWLWCASINSRFSIVVILAELFQLLLYTQRVFEGCYGGLEYVCVWVCVCDVCLCAWMSSLQRCMQIELRESWLHLPPGFNEEFKRLLTLQMLLKQLPKRSQFIWVRKWLWGLITGTLYERIACL